MSDYPAIIEVMKLAEENKRLRQIVSLQEATIAQMQREQIRAEILARNPLPNPESSHV